MFEASQCARAGASQHDFDHHGSPSVRRRDSLLPAASSRRYRTRVTPTCASAALACIDAHFRPKMNVAKVVKVARLGNPKGKIVPPQKGVFSDHA